MTDFSYRINGMFAFILPESPAGEKAMGQVMEMTDGTGKVFALHLGALKAAMHRDGYTIRKQYNRKTCSKADIEKLFGLLNKQPERTDRSINDMQIELSEETIRALQESAKATVLQEIIYELRQSFNRKEFVAEVRNEAVRQMVTKLSAQITETMGDTAIQRAVESVERRVNTQIHRRMQQGIKVSFDPSE